MNARQLLSVGLEIDPQFQGVFARDELPGKKQSLIFNSDPRGKPGTHWMAIYNNEFFCSFATAPPFKDLKQAVTEAPQTLGTSTCGQHALYFIYRRKNNLPLKYSSNTWQNDKQVTKWLRKNYNIATDIIDDDMLFNQICIEYTSNFNLTM